LDRRTAKSVNGLVVWLFSLDKSTLVLTDCLPPFQRCIFGFDFEVLILGIDYPYFDFITLFKFWLLDSNNDILRCYGRVGGVVENDFRGYHLSIIYLSANLLNLIF
jgi:hypothetical protein